MKVKYFAALAAASFVGFGALHVIPSQQVVQANPCAASVNPCAANPCAANPCAANPCAANPCAANPCAANPCAANPCAANPCAANPCAANPCAANPCAANPCAANPCAANPCAANPCAANPCAANPCAAKRSNAAGAAVAYAPATYSDPKSSPGIAIRGYDTVAYFTEGRPVEGSSEFTYLWQGAIWQFSSADNLALFASNPEAYAPQYGGYCAKALSDGVLASTIPDAWKIVDGKLYLNYSAQAQREWEADIPGKIAKADGFWPNVLATADVIYYDSGTVKLSQK